MPDGPTQTVVDLLEGAGVVVRHRDGRHVWVERTTRGETLLALFEQH